MTKVDKIYAMSSFLQFRTVYDPNIAFSEKLNLPRVYAPSSNPKIPIDSSEQLYDYLKNSVNKQVVDGKAAIALSGGMDSAVLAKFMPKGSTAYTLRCEVPNRRIIDETEQAALYCREGELKHKIVTITFEDYLRYTPILMKEKNAPVHSIEPQIYKMALQAKQDGFERLIFADSADMVFGGFDGLLGMDYLFGDFIERYSFVMPYKALKESEIITSPFEKYCNNGFMDLYGFINYMFSKESVNSYMNACHVAGIEFVDPFNHLTHPNIDLTRIRSGEPKYIVREAFEMCYPQITPPKKIPMHRAVDEWFEDWKGPVRSEFIPNCHITMTGDQKYYVWILEKFLDEIYR